MRGCKARQKQESTSLQNPANWNVLLENANYSVNQIITGDKRSPRPFGPSITRNLITRVLTICHVKLTQSTALEQKRFDLRSLSPALRNLWLLLVSTRLACMFCFPNRGPRETWPFVFHKLYIRDEIWKKQFSRVLSHDLYWGNKTYKLKRSIGETSWLFWRQY